MSFPKRKPNRLSDFDYSQNGAYFITICTKERREILWNEGTQIGHASNPTELSEYGVIIDEAIRKIPERYAHVAVDKYVVMPNHVHVILTIDGENGRAMRAPYNRNRCQSTERLCDKANRIFTVAEAVP